MGRVNFEGQKLMWENHEAVFDALELLKGSCFIFLSSVGNAPLSKHLLEEGINGMNQEPL